MMDKIILERLQPMTLMELMQLRYEMLQYGTDPDWVEVIDAIVNGKDWNPNLKTLAEQEFDFT